MLAKRSNMMEEKRNLMHKLFLDTNVLLDFLISERDGNQFAQSIIEMAADDEVVCYISPVSLLNIFYILRKQKTEQERKDIIESFIDILDIVPLDYDILQMGLYAPIKDYEDGIQYMSAKKANVDFIVSSDREFGKHNLDVQIISPEDFVKL